jgi:HD-like signal output (HDOD) protein
MIDGPALTDIIANGKVRVPAAPASAVRIVKAMEDPAFSARQLADIVSVDPPLAAAVLRAANSGEFKNLVPVSSVPDAIARIEVEFLPRLALAMTAADVATNDGPLAQLRLLAWRRSVISAMVCRFAVQLRGGRSADAFACGLLHDFGWIVALGALEDLLAEHPDEKQRAGETWMGLVDQFHILLGHITAVRWDLPPLIAEVILCHHMPEKAAPQHRPLVELVAMSDRVVELLEREPLVTEEHLSKVPGISWDVANRLAQALPKIAADVSQLLDMFPGGNTNAQSKVARPQGTLRGRVKAVHWQVAWMNNKGPVAGTVTAVASDGLSLTLAEPPKENFVIKLALSAPGMSLELFATPVTVERSGGGNRVEARLFGVSGDKKRIWDRLYATTE